MLIYFVVHFIAPILAIIDKAVVCNASGLQKLVPSMIQSTKMLITHPLRFLKQPAFLICWGVYTAIYTTANSINAICERSNKNPLYPKLAATSVVSINLNIAKDREFARLFGVGAPKPMAYSSMALFGTRNAMTMLASFSLPGILSKKLQNEMNMKKQKADMLTQLIIPATMQIFNTPLHLLGYDIYNRPNVSYNEKIIFIKKEYIKTLVARVGHIFPAYGLGGVMNEKIRKIGKEYLNSYYDTYTATMNINKNSNTVVNNNTINTTNSHRNNNSETSQSNTNKPVTSIPVTSCDHQKIT